jgi:hypothetical protein
MYTLIQLALTWISLSTVNYMLVSKNFNKSGFEVFIAISLITLILSILALVFYIIYGEIITFFHYTN